MRVCSLVTCDKKHYARGYCANHWRILADTPAGPCAWEGCALPSRAYGLCNKHVAARASALARRSPVRLGMPLASKRRRVHLVDSDGLSLCGIVCPIPLETVPDRWEPCAKCARYAAATLPPGVS